jgi:hypothetical protein
MARRVAGVVSNEPTTVPQTLQVRGLDTDAHIIIKEGGGVGVSDVGVKVGVGGGGCNHFPGAKQRLHQLREF